MTRQVTVGLLLVSIVYVALHVAAELSEGANWDEYALFARAEKAARTGVLDGGGRPGLGVALLVPFVDGCSTTTTVLVTTRLVWAGFTLGLLAGLFVFLRIAVRRSPRAMHAAALGTAAIALVPAFLRWSLQVRTDQPAVALALWGGVALLASGIGAPRRWYLALVAGLACGTGYLFSQKAIYVTGLVLVVVASDAWLAGAVTWRRELRRAVAFVAGVVVAIVGYELLVPLVFAAPPNAVSLERGLDQFAWYRAIVGLRVYRGMLPTLVPQLVLLAAITFALARASRTRSPHVRSLGVAMLVLLVGVAVGWFHAAAFPYFWITLGLFPAVAIGIGWSSIHEVTPRTARASASVAVVLLAVGALRYRVETLEDTQRIQRTSLAFVDALPARLRGFHPDGALVCRRDPDPLPVFLRESVVRRFSGPNAERNTEALIAELRTRPVAFLVRTHRLVQFPERIQRFWAATYVPYRGAVELAGARLGGFAGARRTLEIIVPGTYRWFPSAPGAARISVGGRVIERRQTVELGVGTVDTELLDPATGILALDVGVDPAPAATPYYDPRPLAEIGGTRTRW